tara:strand:- start:2190 stop:3716 length:1527 start_codon:yes stop_codon:yes gene_type:complete
MAIKRYYAIADTTITNAFKTDLSTRGTGSNMGASDVLEAFVLYGQASSSSGLSAEKSRILVKFPTDNMSSDRSAGTIAASGSVSWYLKLYNAPHSQNIPPNMYLSIHPITQDWKEGRGLDMETYSFSGSANWLTAKSSSAAGVTTWTSEGGDWTEDGRYGQITASFDSGTEDIEIDISDLVEGGWLKSSGAGAIVNYGVMVKFPEHGETAISSSYTKRFFSRESQFFYRRPAIEARWDSTVKDDRSSFYLSSSLASSENINNLYLYNYVRGQLKTIPSAEVFTVALYSGSKGPEATPLQIKNSSDSSVYAVTASEDSTGVYKVQLMYTGSVATTESLYDVWFLGSDPGGADSSDRREQVHTGSAIEPKRFDSGYSWTADPTPQYILSPVNMKSVYSTNEKARFRFFARKRDWNPTIYSRAIATLDSEIIESGSYRIFRVADGLDAVPFGTGSTAHTQMSYDSSGSFFDFDLSMLEPGYSYGIQIAYYNGSIGDWIEAPYEFKFRLEEP